MKFTIKTRLVLAMNLLVIGVGVAVGWAGVKVTGGIIEHRLVDESAQNAAGIFATMHLPFSPEMMSRLQALLGAPLAAGRSDRHDLVASSLPKTEEAALQALLPKGPLPRRVSLNGPSYLIGEAQVPSDPATSLATRAPMTLYLLVPESQVQAAQKASEQTIVLVTFIAILLANALAFWLSATISRPLRRLVQRMDLLASQAAEENPPASAEAAGSAGPPELALLARSFDTLVERLTEARHRLARSTRLATVGQLSAAVAHELRNPLSGIKMNAQVLAEELAKAGVTDSGLDRIIREVERMNVYLEELLELAGDEVKPDRPLELQQLPRLRLEAVAESALGLVERRCQHGHINVERRWSKDAAWVRASEPQLRQVILNLVLNAIDAMPAGGRLTVATSPGAAGGVRLAVTDSGKGVQIPDNKDLFEPFVTTKTAGIGLGLYVCRRNIVRHHGRIGYDSSSGGTTFWFELPAAI
jgi:signal transduction histidine kinase